MVREHQVEQVRCPHCLSLARGTFPPEVNAPAQYGPSVRALGVYLHDYQVLPTERTCEVLGEVWGCPVARCHAALVGTRSRYAGESDCPAHRRLPGCQPLAARRRDWHAPGREIATLYMSIVPAS
jgi:hypothetical protein